MVGYIDDHRDRFGVEPICAVLRIAPGDPLACWGVSHPDLGDDAARSRNVFCTAAHQE